jgi:hypothetical protein
MPGAEDETCSLLIETQASLPDPPFGLDLSRFSTMPKLLKVTARCWQAVNKFRSVDPSPFLDLIARAKDSWDRWVQLSEMPNLHREMTGSKKIRKGIARDLDLYLDSKAVIRCKGRLLYSCLTDDAKHPVLLPRKHHYTRLVIRQAHKCVLHQGVPQTVAEVRQQYWVPQCKQAVKSIIRRCVLCRRVDAVPFNPPPSAPLPDFRVIVCPPFSYVGVDFAGPIPCKDGKVWICLFTCAATRAIHLEQVEGLSAFRFIQAFRKFTARRGTPLRIISDNAQTFKLAQHTLERAWHDVLGSEESLHFLNEKGIRWQYNVERAPWWGGFFERMVGLVKRCLRKCIGHQSLLKCDLEVQLFEIEATLNNRPLTFVSDRVGERPLKPSDALGMRCAHAVPVQVVDDDVNFLSAKPTADTVLRQVGTTQQFLVSFWKRWKHEYLVQLREYHFPKTKKPHFAPSVGEVVLIKDDTPRYQWRLGAIEELIPSRDGYVRAAVVRTSKTRLQRPIQLLIPLEVRSTSATDDGAKDDPPVPEEESVPETTDVEIDAVSQPQTLTDQAQSSRIEPTTRPQRKAAITARQGVRDCLAGEDDEG